MRKLLTLMLLALMFAGNSYAQFASYGFLPSNGTYTEITGGTVLGTETSDDQRFVDPATPAGGTVNTGVGFPIGFNFVFNGVTFDRIGINNNGWISFGQSALTPAVDMATSSAYTPLSSTTIPTNPIHRNRASGLGRDLQAQVGATLRIETIGVSPNMVCVVQFHNYKRYGTAGTGDIVNFQIRLNETSNTVNFVYGSVVPATDFSPAPQVGIGGSSATEFLNRSTITSWAASTPGTVNSATMALGTAVFPSSGLTYTYGTMAPLAAVYSSPTNGASGMPTSVSLNWAPNTGDGGGAPQGYRVYMGTDLPPTNVANGTDVGNVLSYTPATALNTATTYNWQIVPYNTVGNATGNATYNFTTTLGVGTLEGYTTNGFGIPLGGVEVMLFNGLNIISTTSAANGFYQFSLISAGNYQLTATLATYNNTVLDVTVAPSVTTYQNIYMLRPSMAVTPNPYSVGANPNELVDGALNIANNGDGVLGWSATISYTSPGPNSWLTLGQNSGTVAAYSNFNAPLAFNATGLTTGTVKTAEITFHSTPNVGTVVVPVSMTVSGVALAVPFELEANITNPISGMVNLSWSFTANRAFQFFIIKRNGVQVGTTANTVYTETLPAYGVYSYTVQAVYDEGNSAPAGPVVVEWANPTLVLNPTSLYNEQYPNTSETVTFRLSNTGEGTLAYSFPEYAARQLVNSPGFTPNVRSTMKEVEVAKGEVDPTAGMGNRNLRGAGGPDGFGYMWIDSDEDGGPAFIWNDISGTGTAITGLTDDSFAGPFNLGINFPFYANTYSQVFVSSNGFLSFGSGSSSLGNQNLPSSDVPNDLIAWFWDDMNPGVSGTIHYQTIGDVFVIQFTNYNEYSGTGQITAQVHLNQNGDISIYYLDIIGSLVINEATVGIENADGTFGTNINYNSAYVHDNLAIWMGLPTPSFITSVVPASGQVAPGEFVDVVATFTSDDEDFPVGTYNNELELSTNDLANETVLIPATMVVYNPGMISGNVTSADDNAPIHGAVVNAGSYVATTDEEGNYSMIVDAGTYSLTFSKTGYTSVTVSSVVVTETNTTIVDAVLEEIFYAPTLVNAVVNEADTQTDVTWGVPEPSYETLYDDGTAENFAAWALPGNMNAVKFTPAGYPATVYGGRIYVGDGSFPNNNTGFLGTTFGAVVYAADGTNGLPGTTLDSIEVVVNNLGWVDFTGLNATVSSGSFYLAMVQGAVSPNCAPVGIDQTLPTVYRSYSRNVTNGGAWGLSPYQDMMIRAFVSGPVAADDAIASNVTRSPLKQRGMISQTPPLALSGAEGKGQFLAIQDGDSNRDVTTYKIWRVSGFDPNDGPELGTLTLLSGDVENTNYTDAAFGPLPQGWYAYAVAANYTNGGESEKVFSNIVGHRMLVTVTCNVSLTTGGSPAGAVVSLAGQDYPYAVYTQTVPEDGTVVFEDVWKGNYILEANKVGFDEYVLTPNITSNRTFDILLLERKYMPRNLYVDGLTLVATWDEPLAIAVAEDFEGAVFPPAGWQALTQNTTGWYATTNGSSSSFAIPAHTKYAVTNDDADNGDGCCDYLITPELDWSNLPSYRMNFASYFDGSFSQSAYVEISTDAGASWTVINTLNPAPGAWQDLEIDLTQYSGATGLASVWVAFHADDNGAWASGWAVDDIQIASGGVPLQGYGVFLDGTLVDNTPERTYTYSGLNYGQEYLAGVAALFSSGYSELDTYRFTSTYLIPPTDLAGNSPLNTDYVNLSWVAPVTPVDFVASTPVARTEMPLSSVEYSPMVTNVTYGNNNGSRDLWDVLLSFNSTAGLPGLEADDEFIYVSNWQGTNFAKYQFDGTWVEDFTVSGAANIRDMAYDGTFFYGGQASTTIYRMDFETYTLDGTIATSGVSVRHIAYDPQADGGNGGLWAGNWSDLALVSMSGATLQTVSGLPFTGMYGSAWDGQSEGGPFLWIFDQGGNGVDIHQFSIETLALTGVMFDASSVPGFVSGGLAGGLATSNNVVADKFVLLANIQNDPNMIVGLELGAGGGPGPGTTPPNLLGYNIYRDDALVAYVAKPALTHVDLDLLPAVYTYHITAVYDLTPYGFAGQTGESMIEGPIDVEVYYGYELPFTENFNTGLFETNQWTVTGGDNWRIAGQVGNDAPSAEFYYNPSATEYDQSLTSFYMIGSQITDGKIMMDFDLKHTLVEPTEAEFLTVEVSNGGAWIKVGEFKNTASFDWGTQTVDLTGQARGHVFQVRFRANGANTLDIFNWLVDNVSIYRVCPPPTDLVAGVNFPELDQVILNWVAPGTTVLPSAWLGWDNGTNNDAIGLTNGGTFSVAVRFTPAQLGEYAGTSLTKIRMFPYAAGGTIALKVWTGANASNLVLTQPVASYTEGIWNEFALSAPVMVTGTEELWFGYTVTHAAGSYVAGCDAGPAVAGFGDMISLDGSVWESMATAYALDFNWNLNGYVEGVDGVTALQPITDNTVYGTTSQLVRGNLPMLPNATLINNTTVAGRELVGYNVWRDGVLIGNTTETTYVDADEVLEIGNEYCYVVTALFMDSQECESLPSNEACVTLTSTPVIESSAVSIYPNPSNSVVNIELTNDISRVVVYNYVGQVVFEQNVTKSKTIQLNVRNYESGAYLVKFVTNAGESFTKKVVVTK